MLDPVLAPEAEAAEAATCRVLSMAVNMVSPGMGKLVPPRQRRHHPSGQRWPPSCGAVLSERLQVHAAERQKVGSGTLGPGNSFRSCRVSSKHPFRARGCSSPGKTALHLAAESGHASIAQMLLTNGAAADARTLDGGEPHERYLYLLASEAVQLFISLRRMAIPPWRSF